MYGTFALAKGPKISLFTGTVLQDVSLTLNSWASLISETPSQKQAATVRIGISSISFGSISPSIVNDLKLSAVFTLIDPIGSPAIVDLSKIS